jgi:LemA protein
LKDVLAARASATQIKVDINDPETLAKYQAAQGQLQSAFGRLMAVAEAYPDLKTTNLSKIFKLKLKELKTELMLLVKILINQLKGLT